MFLRKTKRRDPVPVTMSGVRMGERLLQVGIDNPAVAGAIASKVGLSGSVAAAVEDEAGAARTRGIAGEAGVLIEVHVAPLDRLPLDDGAFDVVVVHGISRLLGRLDAAARTAVAREWHRVLRRGGRVVTIDGAGRSGLAALFGRGPEGAETPSADTLAVLEAGGFRPVRVVGELEGFTFAEGMKS